MPSPNESLNIVYMLKTNLVNASQRSLYLCLTLQCNHGFFKAWMIKKLAVIDLLSSSSWDSCSALI